MSILTAFYLQDATWWAKGAPDGFGGFAFATPVALKVRWEERTELATDEEGNEFVARSRIYLPQDVEVDDYLFLGTSTVSDPRTVEGAHRVRDFRKIPDLFNNDAERKALV